MTCVIKSDEEVNFFKHNIDNIYVRFDLKKIRNFAGPLLQKVCFSVIMSFHVTLLYSKTNEIKFEISQDREPRIACTVTYFIKFENPTSK